MKKLFFLALSMLILAGALSGCGGDSDKKAAAAPAVNQEGSGGAVPKPAGKILIAYFTLKDIVPEGADAATHATPSIGNTESAAMEIQRQVGGDLFAIKTAQTYPVSHREATAVTGQEMRANARPALTTHVANMDAYDTVYIGYPIWWYMEPMAIRSFLEEYNFRGKTVIPFCTTMGAGIENSMKNIREYAVGANVLEGVTLYTGQNDFSGDIHSWLVKIAQK